MFATDLIVRGMSLIPYGVTEEYGGFLLSGLVKERYTVTTAVPGFLTSPQDTSIPKDGLIRVTIVLQIAQKYTEVCEGSHLPVDTRSAEIVANQPTLDLYRRSPPLLDVGLAQPVPRNNVLLTPTCRNSSPRLASSSASDFGQRASEQRSTA